MRPIMVLGAVHGALVLVTLHICAQGCSDCGQVISGGGHWAGVQVHGLG